MNKENRSNRSYHILVVDDELALRAMLTELLRCEGYRVTATSNGTAARDVLRQQAIDLTVPDLNMAGLDG
jgi:CheY-like chemotaxis protein